MRYFCTYFDHRYLVRGLAMYQSLKRHCPDAWLWVLCLSSECHQALSKLALPGVGVISLEDFERGDRALLAAKANRNVIEYYFTCTPSLPLYVLQQNPSVELITYLDSDLFFYSNPEPIFEELGDNSVAIIPHRFPPQHRWMEQNGIFNVGWLTFRRDEEGLARLKWWRERCLEWCYDIIEENRFADQKYLDRFPSLCRKLKVVEHKGANVAAWNLANYILRQQDGKLWVDDQPLLFYHFQGIRKIAPGVVDPCVQWYSLRVSWLMERTLFRPYMQQLNEIRRFAAPIVKGLPLAGALARSNSDGNPRSFSTVLRDLAVAYRGVLARRYLLSFRS